jgi:acyl-CoA synthetase (AMP-forming)/AMP-acid ligase II
MTDNLLTSIRGKRLIPHIIDQVAQDDPDRCIYAIPRSSNPKHGWEEVTYKRLANAINRAAKILIEDCGPAVPNTFPTVAYIGANDIRYIIVLVAAIKAGYKVCYSEKTWSPV